MNPDLFWLTDSQFSKIALHLPTNTGGTARVDDRRVISGIVHGLKSGGRWIDAPPDYGPKKTLYNRYVRWAQKGVWVALFQTLAQAGGPPEGGADRLLRRESPSLGERRKTNGPPRRQVACEVGLRGKANCHPVPGHRESAVRADARKRPIHPGNSRRRDRHGLRSWSQTIISNRAIVLGAGECREREHSRIVCPTGGTPWRPASSVAPNHSRSD
jgi:transposase